MPVALEQSGKNCGMFSVVARGTAKERPGNRRVIAGPWKVCGWFQHFGSLLEVRT
jgi:hypothetical protein